MIQGKSKSLQECPGSRFESKWQNSPFPATTTGRCSQCWRTVKSRQETLQRFFKSGLFPPHKQRQTDRRRIDPTMTIPGQPQKKGSLQMCREFKGHCATKGREHRCKRCSTTESHTACSQPYSFPSNWHVSQPLLVLLSILIILTTACSTTSVLCSYLWAERQSNSAQRQEGTTSTTQWLNMLQKLSPRRRSESFWKEREKKTRTEKQTTKH